MLSTTVFRSMLLGGLAATMVFGPEAISSMRLFEPRTYDFKDPKGVNGMTFFVDSLVEPIYGTASGVSGTVDFDPAAPEKLSGMIVVDTNSLKTLNASMTSHLLDARWLDAAQFPTIEFASKSVKNLKSDESGVWLADIVGDFTMHGVTKEMTIPVKVTYLQGGQEKRMQGRRGDLVVLRSNFVLNLRDFGVDGKVPVDRVGEKVEIRVAIAGMSKAAGGG